MKKRSMPLVHNAAIIVTSNKEAMQPCGSVLNLMKVLLIWAISVIVVSCNTKSAPVEKSDSFPGSMTSFQELTSKLTLLNVDYTYDVVKQDAENCYEPKDADTIFYNPPYPILGQFNNGRIYSIIHFEPGDDMWPIIRTFDKNGNRIDQITIAFGHCAAGDCDMDSCEEKFRIVNPYTIDDIMTVISTPCDSLGNKDSKLKRTTVWKRIITVDENGRLVTKEDKSNS